MLLLSPQETDSIINIIPPEIDNIGDDIDGEIESFFDTRNRSPKEKQMFRHYLTAKKVNILHTN
jgi:hypothetical protein